jgi:hypothetical protein
VIERALRFGESATLVGVLTQPEPEDRRAGVPGVLLLNSGIIHRVGASRMYVRIARRLAREGFTSLRFDFSGIGDSEPRRDSLAFEESAEIETREAMDHLQRVTSTERFALAGLCSGADMAFRAALADPRVVALAQLDPFAYRTARWFLRHYGPRVLRWSAWRRAVGARLEARSRRSRGVDGAGSPELVAPEYRRRFPPRRVVRDGLRRLAAREVRFFVCFTGGEEHVNYREQYERSFSDVDFGGRLRVEYLPEADHTFTGLREQDLLLERLAGWFASADQRASLTP